MSYKSESAQNPMEELSFILGYFGWVTRFCDLPEEQVQVLIFELHESKDVTETVNVGNLEAAYYKSTGRLTSTSTPSKATKPISRTKH